MPQKVLNQHTHQCYPNDLIFIQSRVEINFAIINEYSQMMEDGVVFDAIEGVQDESGKIYIFDGYHRGEAAKKAGTSLLVNVQSGNRTEAEWLALAANQKHGLRRSNADKQRVVHRALLHPYGVNLSDSELARHCGVNDKTVARIRREMEASSEIPKIDKRLVKRNGVVYEQDTRHIGNTHHERRSPEPEGASPSIALLHKPSLSHMANDVVESNPTWRLERTNQFSEISQPDTRPSYGEQSKYQHKPQAFECPHCGQEKIVGVNGSRRWCLNCGAEWPTAADFLTEVNAAQDQVGAGPSRTELQQRFLNILASLDEQDKQLIQVEIWLDELERRLVLSADRQPATETVAPILCLHSIPILEYA
ncbi:MAG: hypothetical protein AB1801_11770 [Chloroflexota bacterium]